MGRIALCKELREGKDSTAAIPVGEIDTDVTPAAAELDGVATDGLGVVRHEAVRSPEDVIVSLPPKGIALERIIHALYSEARKRLGRSRLDEVGIKAQLGQVEAVARGNTTVTPVVVTPPQVEHAGRTRNPRVIHRGHVDITKELVIRRIHGFSRSVSKIDRKRLAALIPGVASTDAVL